MSLDHGRIFSSVVGSIVSEDLAHGIELTAVANKPIPEIVTDLVTKVTEQHPVRLVHGAATPFPLDVVGLLYSERNQTVVVAGQDLRAGRQRRAGKKIKC